MLAASPPVKFGTSGKGRFRATSHFHWYSPGLELNDLGYLEAPDEIVVKLSEEEDTLQLMISECLG